MQSFAAGFAYQCEATSNASYTQLASEKGRWLDDRSRRRGTNTTRWSDRFFRIWPNASGEYLHTYPGCL